MYINVEEGKIYVVKYVDQIEVYDMKHEGTIRALRTEDEQAEFDRKEAERQAQYDAMDAVRQECDNRFRDTGAPGRVYFSMEAAPLDDVFIEGPCRLIHDQWGEKKHVEDFANPTLWDIVQFANEGIKVTDDHHHCFLEGVRLDKKKSKEGLIPTYYTVMGS